MSQRSTQNVTEKFKIIQREIQQNYFGASTTTQKKLSLGAYFPKFAWESVVLVAMFCILFSFLENLRMVGWDGVWWQLAGESEDVQIVVTMCVYNVHTHCYRMDKDGGVGWFDGSGRWVRTRNPVDERLQPPDWPDLTPPLAGSPAYWCQYYTAQVLLKADLLMLFHLCVEYESTFVLCWISWEISGLSVSWEEGGWGGTVTGI